MEVRIDSRQLTDMLTGMKIAIGDMKKPMDVIGYNMLRSVAKTFQAGGRPNLWGASRRAANEGGRTLMLTGRLRNSIAFTSEQFRVVIGTNLRYARIQQEGGTITGKGGKMLAIPLTREARRLAVGVRSLREIEGLQFIPRKGKPPILARVVKARGKRGERIEPLFVLMKSVKIPARPFLVVQDDDLKMIEKVIQRHIDKKDG